MTTLRITGGTAKGRIVRFPLVGPVRPTSSRVREALFSMVGQDLTGQRVLDAFAGSGMLALEAWSRGADVVLTERHRGAWRRLCEVQRELGVTWDLRLGDVGAQGFLEGAFDGLLADPPYADAPLGWLERLAPLARSWLVYEAQAGHKPPDVAAGLTLDRVKTFGDSTLWVYRAAGGGR